MVRPLAIREMCRRAIVAYARDRQKVRSYPMFKHIRSLNWLLFFF